MTMPPRSRRPSSPVETTSVTSRDSVISAKVAYGRLSGAMPWISSGRRRGSLVLRRRGVSGSAPRSSFGARLRTRCPQYGHSVTYGLTSEPQFLQTTKRSGWLTGPRILGARGRAGPLRARLVDDLADDLAQVVVGLEDHDLAAGPVAAVEHVVDALEGVAGAEVLGVLAQP